MTQRKKYELLSNIPCGEGRFEGKPHERLPMSLKTISIYVSLV